MIGLITSTEHHGNLQPLRSRRHDSGDFCPCELEK